MKTTTKTKYSSREEATRAIYADAANKQAVVLCAHWANDRAVIEAFVPGEGPLTLNHQVAYYRHDPHDAAKAVCEIGRRYFVIHALYDQERRVMAYGRSVSEPDWVYEVEGPFTRE